jgi:hypothetical protein
MSAHIVTAAMVVGIILAGARLAKWAIDRVYAATEGEVRP